MILFSPYRARSAEASAGLSPSVSSEPMAATTGSFESVRRAAPGQPDVAAKAGAVAGWPLKSPDGLAFATGLNLAPALHANALALACWNSSSLITPLFRRSTSCAISSAAPLDFALWTYWLSGGYWS